MKITELNILKDIKDRESGHHAQESLDFISEIPSNPGFGWMTNDERLDNIDDTCIVESTVNKVMGLDFITDDHFVWRKRSGIAEPDFVDSATGETYELKIIKDGKRFNIPYLFQKYRTHGAKYLLVYDPYCNQLLKASKKDFQWEVLYKHFSQYFWHELFNHKIYDSED